MKRLLQSVAETVGVTPHDRIDAASLAECERRIGFRLPSEHAEVLLRSNGLEVFFGYFRLFGLLGRPVDALAWNEPNCWKFAWEGRCSGYWCFGETAWGDQYAYSLDSIHKRETPVYFLDALSMGEEKIADSFAEFFENELLRNARHPYDNMIRLVKEKFGNLDSNSHLVYVPSVLLGGEEDVNNVQLMSARAAMICNGDIAIQLDEGPPDRPVSGVQPYEDEQHRTRLRLIWS